VARCGRGGAGSWRSSLPADLAQGQLPDLALKARLLDLAELAEALVAQLPDLALKARLLDLADLVLVAAVPLQRLLSRQSFSAAMARNTP
jgi:hypothetical protein